MGMDIIQEIKKRQEKINANTERIFKLQQQNMKLREEILKTAKGGVIMYAVSINGLDREGNEHHVDIPDFKYTDTISSIINRAIEDITGSPWFCVDCRGRSNHSRKKDSIS